jgi:hypothetical protein
MLRVELRAGVTLNELRPRIWCGGKPHLKLRAFMEGALLDNIGPHEARTPALVYAREAGVLSLGF